MGVLDFLLNAREAGRGKRAELEDAITYYIPPEMRGLLGLATEMNPVVGMENAGQDAQRMVAPGMSGWDRMAAAGDMASNMAGVMLPMAGAGRAGVSTANAIEEVLTGMSRSPAASGVMDFATGDFGGVPLPGRTAAPFDMGGGSAGMGHNGGPRLNPLASVNLPAGNDPRYLGAAPDRSGGDYPRYVPKKLPERMDRLLRQIDDPNGPINGIFDQYISKGQTLKGDDWYNTEELRDWFTGTLGKTEGDARWREYIDMIGATSAGSPVPTNMRIASFYNALSPEDRMRVASGVNEGAGTPAAVARSLGIEVPNMPDATGKAAYNYGFPYQRLQASNVLNQAQGEWSREIPEGLTGAALTKWLQKNPKVKGFANDLLGNRRNIAADKHFMRILAMADGGTDFLTQQASYSDGLYNSLRDSYGPIIDNYVASRVSKGKEIKEINLAKAARDGVITDTASLQQFPTAWVDIPNDPEYEALEEMVNRVAKQYDMTPAQFQANLWMGAGDVTGLADESQGTFMDLFRRVLDKRAGERGLSREDMLNDFIVNRAPLAIGGAALGGGLLSTGPRDERSGT